MTPGLPNGPAAPEPERGPAVEVARLAAPRHLTSATISGGVVVSSACFLLAGAAEALGVTAQPGDMTDIGALLGRSLSLDPWAWASLGTFIVILTPAIALLATAWEYRTIADRRTVLLALAVLAVLGISAAVALLGH
jgi:uncharacterized membrane protein